MWPWNKDLPTADGRAEFQIENGKMTGGQILLNELTDEEGCGSQLRPYLKSRMKYIGINLADHWFQYPKRSQHLQCLDMPHAQIASDNTSSIEEMRPKQKQTCYE